MTAPVVWFVLAKLALNAEVYADDDWTDSPRPSGNEILFTVGTQTINAWESNETSREYFKLFLPELKYLLPLHPLCSVGIANLSIN